MSSINNINSKIAFKTTQDDLNKENAVSDDLLVKKFNVKDKIAAINQDSSVKSKDAELSKRFRKIVNPNNIPDGHCASCAFNTYLYFNGQELREGREPNGSYKDFGDWFYKKVLDKFDDYAIEAEVNETYASMRNRVEQKVKELTKPGEAVLLSVNEGEHWYNAYNDGKQVWFIDSQSGKGFNLYGSTDPQPEQIVDELDMISIIRLSAENIVEYNSLFGIDMPLK